MIIIKQKMNGSGLGGLTAKSTESEGEEGERAWHAATK